MSCNKLIPATQLTLVAPSTTVQYAWFTDWFAAMGFDEFKGVLKNLARTGNFQSRLAMQTALIRTDNPDSPVQLEASWLGAGSRCTLAVDVSDQTAGKFFARLGIAYNLSESGTPGSADVGVELAYNALGRVLGVSTLQVITPDTSAYNVPLTQWIPAAHVAKVKAAIVVAQASANFRCQLAYQTAPHTKETPGVWNTTSFDSLHSSSGEFNTGELTPAIANEMWVRFGLQHTMTSGSNGQANVSVAVSIRAA